VVGSSPTAHLRPQHILATIVAKGRPIASPPQMAYLMPGMCLRLLENGAGRKLRGGIELVPAPLHGGKRISASGAGGESRNEEKGALREILHAWKKSGCGR
jgi:hypothetical protein